MIEQLTITGIKYDVNETTRKYVTKRLGKLDRFVSHQARKTLSLEVKLKQIDEPHGNKYEVEAILKAPGKSLTAKDSTGNILAAVDIVEAKMTTQLRKYKEKRAASLGKSRSILAKFKRSYDREAQ